MQTKLTLFLLAIIAFSSCARTNFYEHQPLSNLPSEAHNQSIEVFYDENEQPSQDYIEYYDLRLVKRGSFNDRQMVAFLKEEARKKGLDAVMQVNKWDESEERTTLLDAIVTVSDPDGYEPTTTITHSIIEAKGIKYIENIDLSQSIKSGEIVDNSSGLSVGTIHYLPNGLISETEASNELAEIMLDIYYKLSEDRLLYEQKDWQTLHHVDGRIDVRRKYRMNDWLLERVRVRNDKFYNRIKTIRLTENPDQNPLLTKITYHYNKQGQLTERRATGIRLLKENFHYEGDRLISKTIEFGGMQYEVKFDYYQQEDLKELIQKVE